MCVLFRTALSVSMTTAELRAKERHLKMREDKSRPANYWKERIGFSGFEPHVVRLLSCRYLCQGGAVEVELIYRYVHQLWTQAHGRTPDL
ncbi:hypothetical protein EYF80_028744 [Liparis tanakae]|uniref:Uncharacterized protein n=1 Tax=Liparis tanakae TaxID=230148 RepID=A0A4Z2H615_9TELE|nr:hypothetical protein EYF80_028744 [Liparis tanakae]